MKTYDARTLLTSPSVMSTPYDMDVGKWFLSDTPIWFGYDNSVLIDFIFLLSTFFASSYL